MFEDRVEAGKRLFLKLLKFLDNEQVIVIGLTRGGLVTANVVAKNLNLKLIPLIVKKLSTSSNEELAIGAMVSPRDVFWNDDLCQKLNIDDLEKAQLVEKQYKEIKLLEKKLKIKTNWELLKNKTVILIDDGVATGASVIVSSIFLRKQKIKALILATPVISFDTLRYIRKYFDRVIYLQSRKDFSSVGEFYKNFQQILDDETAKIIKT